MNQAAGGGGKNRCAVLYDGGCPICVGAVRRLREADREDALEFVSSRDPDTGARFPDIPAEALEASLHLVEPGGRVRAGADAVEAIMGILPGWRRLAWMFNLPLTRPLARWIYRLVARNRYRIRSHS